MVSADMNTPEDRRPRILLGVTGGIAAYKAPELVRQLLAAGAEVQVVMTDNAHHFVSATSLQAVVDTSPALRRRSTSSGQLAA